MTPAEMLQKLYQNAVELDKSIIEDSVIREKIEFVCRSSAPAAIRLLMACLLGKLDNPQVDPRKPYTKIGGQDSFSGRHYDEDYLSGFISANHLPLNPTTAFLNPSLRIDAPLNTDQKLTARPPEPYKVVLALLEDVALNRSKPDVILTEIIRILVIIRDEKAARLKLMLGEQKCRIGTLPLSSEAIVTLIEQHLKCNRVSRLPVLIVAAAYKVASTQLSERILPLRTYP